MSRADARLKVLQAMGFLLRRDYESMAAACEEAVRLCPTFDQAHFQLGNALLRLGRWEESSMAFLEVVRLSPDNMAAYGCLAMTLRMSGNLPGALLAAQEALRLRPENATVQYEMAQILEEQGNTEAAILQLQASLNCSDSHRRLTILHKLGVLHLQLGRAEEAEFCWRMMLVGITTASDLSIAASLLRHTPEGVEFIKRLLSADTQPDAGASE